MTFFRYILEVNPGEGILSKSLLDLGAQRLTLYETRKSKFHAELQKIRDEHPDRVTLITENLIRMASISRFDLVSGSTHLQDCFRHIPHHSIRSKPAVTVFMALPPFHQRRFLLALVYSFAEQSMIFSIGNVELVIFLSKHEYGKMMAVKGHSHRAGPTLFNIFFDHQFLGSVSSSAFSLNSGLDVRARNFAMELVRLTPSYRVHEMLKYPRRVEEFTFFVRQAFTRGATLIYLNQLIPDAARYILLRTRWAKRELLDLDVDTKIHKLRPEEVLRLFEILTEHPLYPQCPLASALESEPLKTSAAP